MSHTPQIDIGRVSAAYERRVRAACGGEFPAAVQLRDRLDPSRWQMEWHLAVWLGDAFGLDQAASLDITLSNVVGLASLRLRDDIADGELSAEAEDPAEHIAAALYDAALAFYRETFPGSSPLWSQVELRMAEWRTATLTPDQAGARELARRGAPLKISAFAICLLTGREADFRVLENALDNAISAMVLYDHVVDWREDIAARRWNAFVERALLRAAGQHPATTPERDVRVSLLTTDAIERHFAVIANQLDTAEQLARHLDITGLAQHMHAVREELGDQGRAMAQRYADLAERGQRLLFRHYPHQAA